MKIKAERQFSDGEKAYDFMWILRMHGTPARLSIRSDRIYLVMFQIEEELMGYDILEDTSG